MEIWKSIKGFEGFYEASSFGRIRGLDRKVKTKNRWGECYIPVKGKIIKTVPDKNGYHSITLKKNEKIRHAKVHRIIAETFIPNPNNYPQVNHKDENKSNNSVDNLEWCTAKYNANYGSKIERARKRGCIKVLQKKNDEVIAEYYSIHEAGRKTGINFKNIHSVCTGKRKNAGGYQWEYMQ